MNFLRHGYLAVVLVVVWMVLLALVACRETNSLVNTSPPTPSQSVRRLQVLTSIAPLTGLVLEIGGDRIDVTQLKSDQAATTLVEGGTFVGSQFEQAHLIFVNGLGIDDDVLQFAQRHIRAGTDVVVLSTRVLPQEDYIELPSSLPEAVRYNPYLWLDPLYALRYAQLIRDLLQTYDPVNELYYQNNFEMMKRRLLFLHRVTQRSIRSIPVSQAIDWQCNNDWAYWGRRYHLNSGSWSPVVRTMNISIQMIRKSSSRLGHLKEGEDTAEIEQTFFQAGCPFPEIDATLRIDQRRPFVLVMTNLVSKISSKIHPPIEVPPNMKQIIVKM